MARRVTIRGVHEEVLRILRAEADARGTRLNAMLLEILGRHTGASERRERLSRYATWSAADAQAFDAALRARRVVDPQDWE